MNFKYASFSCFLIIIIACNNSDTLFKKVCKSDDTSVLIFLYNPKVDCVGCDITLKLISKNIINQCKYQNKVVLLNEIRALEKPTTEKIIKDFGIQQYSIVYNNYLYNILSKKLTGNSSAGGIIILNHKDIVEFEASFKNENLSDKLNQIM